MQYIFERQKMKCLSSEWNYYISVNYQFIFHCELGLSHWVGGVLEMLELHQKLLVPHPHLLPHLRERKEEWESLRKNIFKTEKHRIIPGWWPYNLEYYYSKNSFTDIKYFIIIKKMFCGNRNYNKFGLLSLSKKKLYRHTNKQVATRSSPKVVYLYLLDRIQVHELK